MKHVPQNGYYFTSEDTYEYNNTFSKYYNEKNKCASCVNCMCSESNYIRTITFIVTEECNLNCSYCYEVCKTKRRMSKEVARAGVDMLFDSEKINHYFSLEETKGYIIEFFGGEPFLEPELIEYIIEYFLQKAYLCHKDIFKYSMFSTTTNGTTYFNPKVQDVVKRYINKFSIGITIDGNKELHDTCRRTHDNEPTYDLVEKAVKAHNQLRTDTNDTKLTLAPANITYLYDALINLWESVGVQIVFANCVFEKGWEDKHAEILYDQLVKIADYLLTNENYKKYHTTLFDETIGKPVDETFLNKNFCGGNGNMLAITPDGNLYPCSRFAPYSLANQKGLIIGNVFDGIDKVNENLSALKAVTMRTQSTNECLNCNIASGCAICTGYNYDEFGTPNRRATYICDMHKARVRANAYYYNKLYKELKLDQTFEMCR